MNSTPTSRPRIKQAVSIPVTVVGGITTPELAEQLIAEGKCDLVALARQLTADPEFANKAQSGQEDDILPCLRCYKCFPGPLEDNIHDLSTLFGCSVNPEAFYFDQAVLESKPVSTKKVLVIGGGIGGMEAAVIAAERGHQVTLVEKSDALGGLLKFADTDAYKGDLGKFKDVMARRVVHRKVDVRLNTEFSPADVNRFGAEAVIVAVGSGRSTPGSRASKTPCGRSTCTCTWTRSGHRWWWWAAGLWVAKSAFTWPRTAAR